jgi:hypothetical protein
MYDAYSVKSFNNPNTKKGIKQIFWSILVRGDHV